MGTTRRAGKSGVTDRVPGSVWLVVRCQCPTPWVPFHVTKELVALLQLAAVAPDFPVAVVRCKRCKTYGVGRVRDIPMERKAA